MKIDDRIESTVRDLLNAVVKSKENDFEVTLRELPDSASREKALELAVAVCVFVVIDTYDRRPMPDEIREIAQDVVEAGSWMSLTEQEVAQFLTAALDGKPLAQVLDAHSAFFLAFIITGILLVASPKVGEGELWFNYLDRVEAAIEATPAT
ncbi:hypothetical protein ACIBSW_19310 [Actinoplanes sp. NPDC049668]|uniref:hypothetical protein n=1 Tax=unclassified Actinoplanes TaxID=2626549 RepID=UPI0033BF6EE2